MADHPPRFRLVQWVAGDLDPAATAELRAHLDTCSECSRSAEAIRDKAERFESVRAAQFERITSRLGAGGRPAAVVQLADRRRWGWWAGASAAALAAAAMLLLSLWPPTPAALPGFGLEVSGGEKVVRGEAPGAAVPRLRPSSRLEITLRPATPVADPNTVRLVALLQTPEGLDVLDWTPRVSASGTLMMDGLASELVPAAPGRYTLWLVVCPAGQTDRIPLDPGRLATPPEGAPWQAKALPLELIPE